MRRIAMLACTLPLLAGGCVRTIASVATAPVRATSQVVDWTTTSQSEADRNYGRKMRKQEAREGAARRKAAEACRDHPDDCRTNDASAPEK